MVASEALFQSTSSCITEQHVKAALDDLHYGSRNWLCNPLEGLELIEDAIIASTLPVSPFSRTYLLSQILISMISEELCCCRRAQGTYVIPASETSHKAALEAIAKDAKTGCAELLIWNWLYYHYVRVDFDISPNVFCRIASINQRSLQRYRQCGIRRLVFRLIEREQLIRKKTQKRQLYAQLPRVSLTPLFSRQAELHWFENRVHCGQPISMQVIGGQGIGKTVFVQKAVRHLIETDSIELLFWFDKPTSVRAIEQRLAIFIQEQGLFISVREFVQCRKIAVIIDGMDTLSNELERLEDLLDDLDSAMIFLTSRVPISLRNMSGHIILPELERSEAEQFIRSLISNWHYRYFEQLNSDDLEAILEQTRGNPRLIEKAVWKLQAQRVSEDNSGKLLTVFG
jgi:hypothetical protein